MLSGLCFCQLPDVVSGGLPNKHMRDYVTPKKWKCLHKKHANCGRITFFNGKPAAYWFCVPVIPEVYDDLRDGKNVNSSITLRDAPRLVPGWNSLYSVDFLEDKEFRGRLNRALPASFIDFLFEKASDQSKVFVDRGMPHLNWSTVVFGKRRTENGKQAIKAGTDCLEVTAG